MAGRAKAEGEGMREIGQFEDYSGDRVLDAWLKANRDEDAEGIAYNASNYWKVVVVPGPFDYVDGSWSWP